MYKIVRRRNLNDCVTLFEVDAPEVAKAFKPGQFAILRVDEAGERFPLTIAAADPARGTVTIVFLIVGKSTRKLNALQEGYQILDFAGPWETIRPGWPREVCLVVGGVEAPPGIRSQRRSMMKGQRWTPLPVSHPI